MPLKAEYYEQFKLGKKRFEYRKYGKRFNENTCSVGRYVMLSKGYGKLNRIYGKIVSFNRVKEHNEDFKKVYGDTDSDMAVIGIELKNNV